MLSLLLYETPCTMLSLANVAYDRKYIVITVSILAHVTTSGRNVILCYIKRFCCCCYCTAFEQHVSFKPKVKCGRTHFKDIVVNSESKYIMRKYQYELYLRSFAMVSVTPHRGITQHLILGLKMDSLTRH